jgi:anaerobic selenocysteine-containing dehydrogenase
MEALRSLDFVAAAHTITPTAEQADIVLPKATTLEEELVSCRRGPTVLFTRALVPPQGECALRSTSPYRCSPEM